MFQVVVPLRMIGAAKAIVPFIVVVIKFEVLTVPEALLWLKLPPMVKVAAGAIVSVPELLIETLPLVVTALLNVTPDAFVIVIVPRAPIDPSAPLKVIVPEVPALSVRASPVPLIVLPNEILAPVVTVPAPVVSNVILPAKITGFANEMIAPLVVILLEIVVVPELVIVIAPRGTILPTRPPK